MTDSSRGEDRPLVTNRFAGRLAVAGAAADARKTSGTARHAAGTPELASGAAADARDAALPARTSAGAAVLAAGAAVAVDVTAAAARVLLEDHMRGCRVSRRAGRESFSCSHRRYSDRRSNSSTNHQRFHQIQFR
jgi:hypothetical protein